MDRLTERFFSRVQVLQNQLETLLQKDWGPDAQVKLPFEVQTDLKQLETLGWSLPSGEPQRSDELFQRLRAYFECGFSFRRSTLQTEPGWIGWQLEAAFSLGEPFPLLPEDLEKKLALPEMTLEEIRKLKPEYLLEEFRFEEFFPSQEMTALVIRPMDQKLWVLFSGLAPVFLKGHIQQIQNKCLHLLADLDESDAENKP